MTTGRRPRRVFLSHTGELRRYPARRSFVEAAEAAVARAGDGVCDMSYLPASRHPPAETCAAAVRDSDVLVLVAGFRYGSTVPGDAATSYTELEYRTATDHGIPRLVFVLGEDAEGPRAMFDDDAGPARSQDAFRGRLLRDGPTAAVVQTPDELETALVHALLALDGRTERGDGTRWAVTVENSYGVLIGDGGIQVNRFGSGRPEPARDIEEDDPDA